MKLKHKKELGQNFLTDRKVAFDIIDASGISKDDIVIEIGPGAGILTQYLISEAKQLIAVEYDERFVHMLRNRFKEEDNVKIVGKDILEIDVSKEFSGVKEYKMIGSLPYNISKKIIEKFLELENPPQTMTFLIQKEVAEDYASQPPKATFLSNYVQIFGEAELVRIVPKSFFNPEPKVDGGIVQFTIPDDKLPVKERNRLTKFLKSGFLNPRKKLVNNLNAIYKIDKSELKEIFSHLGIDENARAGNLTLGHWKKLAEQLTVNRSQ